MSRVAESVEKTEGGGGREVAVAALPDDQVTRQRSPGYCTKFARKRRTDLDVAA